MKYLTLFILALFLFQASYTQELDIVTGEQNTNWTDLNIDDFLSDESNVQAKDFGVQWLVSQMIADQIISNSSSWDLTNITSVQSQRMNGVNYKIAGIYTNDEGEDFTGEFIINYFAIGPAYEVFEVSYEHEGERSEIEINEDGSESFVEAASEVGVYTPVPLLSQEELEEEYEDPVYWNFVNTSEAASGGELESAVNDGVETAITNGLATGALPEGTTWSLQSVDYIQRRVLDEYTKYYFWVTLTDGDIQNANGAICYVENADGSTDIISTGFWKIGAIAV